MATYKKNYFVSIKDDEAIICQSPENSLLTYEEMNDPKLRFLYKVGDKVLTSFGIETIKNIDYNYGSLEKHHGYEWLITVEENGNQYKPIELIGIVKQIINSADFYFLLL